MVGYLCHLCLFIGGGCMERRIRGSYSANMAEQAVNQLKRRVRSSLFTDTLLCLEFVEILSSAKS